jgi:hypothetical protein
MAETKKKKTVKKEMALDLNSLNKMAREGYERIGKPRGERFKRSYVRQELEK